MRQKEQKGSFQTHIPEPRWQQVVSVLVVVAIALVWVWAAFH